MRARLSFQPRCFDLAKALRDPLWAASQLPSTCLGHNELHFWWARVPTDGTDGSALAASLAHDEQERAARFKVATPRQEYIVTRYILRHLLSAYVRQPAAALGFAYQAHGKPFLPDQPALGFSASHSHGLAVFGFAWNYPVGVDVEKAQSGRPVMQIAERFFSERERSALRRLPEEEWNAAFFRIWTRKEAYIKALGEGLSHGLGQFDVSLEAGAEDALLATRPDPAESARWLLREAEVPSPYVAAAAIHLG